MKSPARHLLPTPLRRSLTKFGADIRVARRKRQLTIAMMCERVGITKVTYLKVERGDAGVSLGIYAMTLFVLGLGVPFSELVDPRSDEAGLLSDESRLPQRVRVPTR